MVNVITDKAKVEEVLSRGVENIYPDKETALKILTSGKRLRIYCGFDPTAPSLHIGNAIQINKLAQLQELGHEIVFLVGGFTGMIGDPTDKGATRKQLTREEVEVNAKSYKKQASAYLKFSGENPARVLNNSKWFDKMTFKELIELAAYFTVGQMITRDMFQERIKNEKPIHLHEFLYPLAQGYDTIAMKMDVEVGGNDQTFNMLAGRHLAKVMEGREKLVITTKLLADDTGKKMGKSEGNAVFLDQAPENVYGCVMSWPDGVIVNALELATRVSVAEVAEVKAKLAAGANPRDYKMKLAFEITKLIHGERKAKAAEGYFVRTIQKKEAPATVASRKSLVASQNIIELLVEHGLASSKGEARRLVEQGGIKVDGVQVKDVKAEIDLSKEKLIQRGKLQFIKVGN